MLSEKEVSFLEAELSRRSGSDQKIMSTAAVSGGSINDAYKLETATDHFFVKRNARDKYPGMFEVEAKGLELLRKHSDLEIPRPVLQTDADGQSYLVLTWLEEAGGGAEKDFEFGKKLAGMHRVSNDRFGLDHDNYMGSLVQTNTPKDSWAEFFVEQRLAPQVKLARDAGLLSAGDVRKFERFYAEAARIFPEEPPALIHGDLWGGNFMHTTKGTSVFDPAVAFAHREQDIAMTQLFGGFNRAFYEGYEEEYPLNPGWRERLDAANVYPLLIHVNLFGGGYLAQTQSVISRFT